MGKYAVLVYAFVNTAVPGAVVDHLVVKVKAMIVYDVLYPRSLIRLKDSVALITSFQESGIAFHSLQYGTPILKGRSWSSCLLGVKQAVVGLFKVFILTRSTAGVFVVLLVY